MTALGVHGCSVITAITAQNTHAVLAIAPVSKSMLRAQLQALKTDLPPAAIKTGMLGQAETCRIVADFLHPMNIPLVCDPVLQSTSGSTLLESAAREILIQQIFPKVTVLTPNLPEVEALINKPIQTVEAAAEHLLGMGIRSVLIKGGHAAGDTCCDYWTDGSQTLWLSSPRIETQATHGTGCILSSAIAAALALGQELPEAIITAKTFLNQCLKSPAHLGTGLGPMRIELFKKAEQDRPTMG